MRVYVLEGEREERESSIGYSSLSKESVYMYILYIPVVTCAIYKA